jgi:TetR/AcrR family transcriptional regulator, transcriptional repressor of aconitase
MTVEQEKSSRVPQERPARLTRKESQTRTRTKLIAVARRHFLRDGVGAAVADKIAEEAGFSRGALYANFKTKEDLFLAVIESSVEANAERVQSILHSNQSAKRRFEAFREAVADRVTQPDWVILQAEFQANALRNVKIRKRFLEVQRHRAEAGAAIIRESAEVLGLTLSASPEDIVALLGSLSEGLAVRQTLARPRNDTHARRLALLCFDRLVARR